MKDGGERAAGAGATRRDFGLTKTAASPHCKLRSVDLSAVRWTRGFWADRFKQCREVTLPHLWRRLADPKAGHALQNLRIAAGLDEGEFAGTHWQDAWVYKWLEAAAAVYEVTRDEALDRRMDEVVAVIARAQQPDGYIASQITVRGWKRWQQPIHHELYTMGHLMTAACIHHRVTGKGALLAVARKAADHVYATFKSRDPNPELPLNPSIIMGAAELYRTTGDRKYLHMTNLFIDRRGAAPRGCSDQNQNAVPLREETQVVGHAVFFTYLFAGAADAYMETGDRSLLEALERLWDDLTQKRMYVTGGVCALHRGLAFRAGQSVWQADVVCEAAGFDYDLPSATAYNETCAQIGSFMWNWRMLAITGDAKYADLMERQLYNSILSGMGLDGASWFYTNVLRHYGKEQPKLRHPGAARFQPGRRAICCPTNLLRTVAELRGYLYAVSDDGLWVNHYGASTFDGALADGSRLKLAQETDYPWDGRVRLTIEAAPPNAFGLRVRIPAWAEGAAIAVNGKAAGAAPKPGTYAAVRRRWASGDVVELTLPMTPRLIGAHRRVEAARNQAAVARGPLIYCLESPDLPKGVRLSEIYLPRDVKLSARHDPRLLGGVTVLEGKALRLPEDEAAARLYHTIRPRKPEEVAISLIPYHVWANRGESEMSVWLPLY